MVEPVIERIKRIIRNILCKLTKHKYGCCNKYFKNCSKCLIDKTPPKDYCEEFKKVRTTLYVVFSHNDLLGVFDNLDIAESIMCTDKVIQECELNEIIYETVEEYDDTNFKQRLN